MRPDCIGGFGPVGTNGPTDTVESVLAEMRVEANLPTISAMHERTLSRLDAWADRLAAAHELDAAALAASEARAGDLATGYIDACYRATVAEQSLAAMQARVNGLEAALRAIYQRIPDLPITPETSEAATDALTEFCLMMGFHDIPDDAAIAAQRQETGNGVPVGGEG